jgi:hypothetical protein
MRSANRPLEWTGPHQLSATPPQANCLPLGAALGRSLWRSSSCYSTPSKYSRGRTYSLAEHFMNHLLSNTKSRIVSRALQALAPSGFYFRQQGYCSCCRNKTYFVSLDSWLRDNFKCSNCGSMPRNRERIQVLQKYYPNWKDLAIHESSPSGGGASALIRRHCAHYIASQYYPMHPPGSIVGEYRNEDLERQTYADGSFDVVITQDVMEHIYDPSSAFREIARTLRPVGDLISSAFPS